MDESGLLKPFVASGIEKNILRSEWEKWVRNFELYCESNDITDTVKKRTKLLLFGGKEIQDLAENIPKAMIKYNQNDDNDVYKHLKDKLTVYFVPERNPTIERHLFRNIKQKEGEGFSQFVLRLREQAKKCDFGRNMKEATDINIKDQIIENCGTLELRKKLMEKELSLNQVINMCQVHDQLNLETKMMHAPSNNETGPANVNKIDIKKNSSHKLECGRCGHSDHGSDSPSCPAIRQFCSKCGFKGHFAKKCRSKRKSSQSNENRSHKRFKSVNYVEEDPRSKPTSTEKIEDYYCFRVDSGKMTKLSSLETISCNIGDSTIEMIIDSGCEPNIICGSSWKKLENENANMFAIDKSISHSLKSYASRNPLNISHKFDAKIAVENGNSGIATYMWSKMGIVRF
jgi:hypothetical protein